MQSETTFPIIFAAITIFAYVGSAVVSLQALPGWGLFV